MSRPFKCRRVAFIPGVTFFKPAAIPLRSLEIIQLTIEEAEAIRLKDLEGLDQEQAAVKMNISRPTFQRVLYSAHKKMADALHNGKAIKIDGGNFEVTPRRFRCVNRHVWDMPSDTLEKDILQQQCPICSSPNINPIQHDTIGSVPSVRE